MVLHVYRTTFLMVVYSVSERLLFACTSCTHKITFAHCLGTPPRVVNVAVNNDLLTWELQSDFTGKIYHYRLLVYKDGQERGDGKSLETENDYYDLSTLNLSPGDYDIEV